MSRRSVRTSPPDQVGVKVGGLLYCEQRGRKTPSIPIGGSYGYPLWRDLLFLSSSIPKGEQHRLPIHPHFSGVVLKHSRNVAVHHQCHGKFFPKSNFHKTRTGHTPPPPAMKNTTRAKRRGKNREREEERKGISAEKEERKQRRVGVSTTFATD